MTSNSNAISKVGNLADARGRQAVRLMMLGLSACVISAYQPSQAAQDGHQTNSLKAERLAQLAHSSLHAGKSSAAIEYATKALDLDGKCASAYAAMALAVKDVASARTCISICTRGIRANPDDARLHGIRADLYSEEGENDKAIADIEFAIRKEGERSENLKKAQKYYARELDKLVQEDKKQEAFHLANSAVSLHPNNEALIQLRAEIFCNLGDYGVAATDVARLIELRPNDIGYRKLSYLIHTRLHEYDLALTDCRNILKIDPAANYIYELCGDLHIKMRQWQEAISDYTVAINKGLDGSRNLEMRGLAYFKIGQLNNAIEDLNVAIDENPFLAEAYHIRGEAYSASGKKTEAKLDFERELSIAHRFGYKLNPRDLCDEVELNKVDEEASRPEQLRKSAYIFQEPRNDADSFLVSVSKNGGEKVLSIPTRKGRLNYPNSALKGLTIDKCRLTRPDTLGQIGKLEHIGNLRFVRCQLGSRSFDELVRNAAANPRLGLRNLVFRQCTIAKSVYERAASLPDLASLQIQDCNLNDEDLQAFSKMKVTSLLLGNTQITDAGLRYLYSLKRLRSIELASKPDARGALTTNGARALKLHLPSVRVVLNTQEQ